MEKMVVTPKLAEFIASCIEIGFEGHEQEEITEDDEAVVTRLISGFRAAAKVDEEVSFVLCDKISQAIEDDEEREFGGVVMSDGSLQRD